MNLTIDQAIAHLESIAAGKRGDAVSYRQRADEYQRAANATTESGTFRRMQFENAAACQGDARAADRDAEAINIVLAQVRSEVR